MADKSEKIQKDNLCQILGEIERTIQELSRQYADLSDSNHFGIGGIMKPTVKQDVIKQQLDEANKRADRLLKAIEKL